MGVCTSVRTITGFARRSRSRLLVVAAKVGTGTRPACADTTGQAAESAGRLTAFAIPGVSARTAVVADGDVWVRRGTTALPAPLRALFTPVRCTSTERFTVAGTLTGISAMPRDGDDHVHTPYTAELAVDDGPRSLLDGYSRVRISARVTSATKGGDDAGLLRPALSGGRRVAAVLRCAGDRFVTTSLRLTR